LSRAAGKGYFSRAWEFGQRKTIPRDEPAGSRNRPGAAPSDEAGNSVLEAYIHESWGKDVLLKRAVVPVAPA